MFALVVSTHPPGEESDDDDTDPPPGVDVEMDGSAISGVNDLALMCFVTNFGLCSSWVAAARDDLGVPGAVDSDDVGETTPARERGRGVDGDPGIGAVEFALEPSLSFAIVAAVVVVVVVVAVTTVGVLRLFCPWSASIACVFPAPSGPMTNTRRVNRGTCSVNFCARSFRIMNGVCGCWACCRSRGERGWPDSVPWLGEGPEPTIVPSLVVGSLRTVRELASIPSVGQSVLTLQLVLDRLRVRSVRSW